MLILYFLCIDIFIIAYVSESPPHLEIVMLYATYRYRYVQHGHENPAVVNRWRKS